MSKLFLINLKSNLTVNQTKDYFKQVNKLFKKQNENFVFFINHLSAHLSLNKYKFSLGIQSFFQEKLGAYTSCNTLEQIKEFETLKYCLLGHCEELKYFNLLLEDINSKIICASNNNLKLVVCFGDDKLEDFNDTINTLFNQIKVLLNSVSNFDNIILAYEPKYAVNTTFKINPEQINLIFRHLKQKLFDEYNHNFEICYGGNVNGSNLNDFIIHEHIDGFLIGRYGLKIENIKDMLNLVKNKQI